MRDLKLKNLDNKHTDQQGYSLNFLRNTSLFYNLSDDLIARFQKATRITTHKKDKFLYLQDDPAQYFYIICSGWIKLFYTMHEGEEVIVDMLTRFHMVGESAIFEDGRHTSSAQVIEDVQLLSIPSNLLKEQIRLNSALSLNLLSALSRHHRRHYGELSFNAMLGAPQRIGCFLLRLCSGSMENSVVFYLPYEKTLIAKTLGMNGATFSRALNILRLKSGIQVYDTRVEIESIKRLTSFVYGTDIRDINRIQNDLSENYIKPPPV